MQMRCCDNEKECLNESDNPARLSRSDDVMLTAKRAALGTSTEGCISVFFWTLLVLCTHDFLINIAPGFLLQSPVACTCSHIPATMLAKSSASESGGLALVDKKQGRCCRSMCMQAFSARSCKHLFEGNCVCRDEYGGYSTMMQVCLCPRSQPLSDIVVRSNHAILGAGASAFDMSV